MASETRVACHGCGQMRRTRWAFVGSFASGYRGTHESSLLRSDWQVRIRGGNRCRGTSAAPAGRAAGSARPKISGCILEFYHFAFHCLSDLRFHFEVAYTWFGLGLGFTATDEIEVRGGEGRRDIASWRTRRLPRLTEDRRTPLHAGTPATRKRSDGFPKPASRSGRLSRWFSSRPWRKTSSGWDPPHEHLQDLTSPWPRFPSPASHSEAPLVRTAARAYGADPPRTAHRLNGPGTASPSVSSLGAHPRRQISPAGCIDEAYSRPPFYKLMSHGGVVPSTPPPHARRLAA
jgi:hypothetical protein